MVGRNFDLHRRIFGTPCEHRHVAQSIPQVLTLRSVSSLARAPRRGGDSWISIYLPDIRDPHNQKGLRAPLP
jgi:hypothetical protein